MIRTDNKNLCCGCETCGLVCPKNCISFECDSLGHKYPHVDKNLCVNCRKCESVCPIQNNYEGLDIGNEAHIVYSKDVNIRRRGSSGGVFETIAKWIVGNEGAVFACRFDDNLKLKCFEANTEEEVKKLTKSKYLQSESVDSFPLMKQRILGGKKVLFVSTPCQVAAFKSYLGKLASSDNVFLVDFFCHGVPSQDFFDMCKDYVERKEGISVKEYEFRSKIKNGKTPHYYSLTYKKNGKIKRRTSLYLLDPFYLGFQKYITLRDCCYTCPFGRGNHSADMTMGDFHNVDRYISGINRFDGCSSVLINNEKGQFIWNQIKGSLLVHDIDINTLYQNKEIYSGGTQEPRQRQLFLADIQSGMPFDALVDKWLNGRTDYKKRIYYAMPNFIRNMAKKICGM